MVITTKTSKAKRTSWHSPSIYPSCILGVDFKYPVPDHARTGGWMGGWVGWVSMWVGRVDVDERGVVGLVVRWAFGGVRIMVLAHVFESYILVLSRFYCYSVLGIIFFLLLLNHSIKIRQTDILTLRINQNIE